VTKKITSVPAVTGTGNNTMNRKISKTVVARDENGQEIKYIIALFRGCALNFHDSQSIRIWYNYSHILGRYKASTTVFCALDMEDKACEIYDALNTEDDVKRILAEPIILHTGKWW